MRVKQVLRVGVLGLGPMSDVLRGVGNAGVMG